MPLLVLEFSYLVLSKVIHFAFSPNETMKNFPIKLTEKMVYKAIMEVDQHGQKGRRKGGYKEG